MSTRRTDKGSFKARFWLVQKFDKWVNA